MEVYWPTVGFVHRPGHVHLTLRFPNGGCVSLTRAEWREFLAWLETRDAASALQPQLS